VLSNCTDRHRLSGIGKLVCRQFCDDDSVPTQTDGRGRCNRHRLPRLGVSPKSPGFGATSRTLTRMGAGVNPADDSLIARSVSVSLWPTRRLRVEQWGRNRSRRGGRSLRNPLGLPHHQQCRLQCSEDWHDFSTCSLREPARIPPGQRRGLPVPCGEFTAANRNGGFDSPQSLASHRIAEALASITPPFAFASGWER